MTDSGEAAAFLPGNIREALKRKSSRDPSSRFPTKLHLLLAFVEEHPDMAEKVGVEWLPDDEFRMNKAVLSEVMGIKINTLNVNLRDRNFTQLQRDKEGWTKWRRDGFTKNSRGLEYEAEVGQAPQRRQNDPVGGILHMGLPTMMEPDYEHNNFNRISLGKLGLDEQRAFDHRAQQLWCEINTSVAGSNDQELLIRTIADRFRYKQQPLDNSVQVIKAIIAPNQTMQPLTFYDFCKLLAMFGPEDTIMLKISSLLKCSNNTGQWLRFDNKPGDMDPSGMFDSHTPNCLVIRKRNGSTCRVYNHPLRAAPEEDSTGVHYVIDETGRSYPSWEDYFEANPVAETDGRNHFYA